MIAVLVAAGLAWTQAGATDKVAIDPVPDLVVTAVAFAGFAVPELLKGQLAPAHCRICDGRDNTGLPGSGDAASVNGVDAFFHDRLTGFLLPRQTADMVSSVWAFALLPAGTLAAAFTATGPHATEGAGLRAAVIVIESAAVSAALVQGVKFLTARKRPFVRYGDGTAGGGTYDVGNADSRLGLPSGHTALATSLGVSLAMTATLEESSAAPWLWGAAAAMSITTGALRVMAEKHYFADVAVGGLIGAASGVAIPLLHRRGGALAGSSVSVAGRGPAIALSGVF